MSPNQIIIIIIYFPTNYVIFVIFLKCRKISFLPVQNVAMKQVNKNSDPKFLIILYGAWWCIIPHKGKDMSLYPECVDIWDWNIDNDDWKSAFSGEDGADDGCAVSLNDRNCGFLQPFG